MKQLLKINTAQVNKKGLKRITRAICDIMYVAQETERSDATTIAALEALSKTSSVSVINSNFQGK